METYLEINLENLKKNVKNLKSLLKAETKFLAVVKSNAYGHGLVECAQAASQAGANWFGVVYLEEAMSLRKAGIVKPILIIKSVSALEARQAANQDISVPIISLSQAHEIADIAFDKPLKVHLKIDTGLNRLGMENSEIEEAVKVLKSNTNIIIEGIYSHLASVEEGDMDYTDFQIKNFRDSIKIVEGLGYKDLIKHLAATSGTLLKPEAHFDMVRCGIGLYGLWPSADNKEAFGKDDFLFPVMNYKTSIDQIKEVKAGEKIGYGCGYETEKDMTIGIIPVGYYEGIDRGLGDMGKVLVGGVRCPIIGRVCMNLAIIDISNLNPKSEYRNPNNIEVTIMGKDGQEEITADELADLLGTINYEVVTRIPECVERKFV